MYRAYYRILLCLSNKYSICINNIYFLKQSYMFRCLTLSNPTFLPPAYSPALIYFGRERGLWVTCNYPTVLKEKNINRNRKNTTGAICWLKSILHGEKRREQENHNIGLRPTLWFSCSQRFSSCSTDFSQQIAQVVLFPFMFSRLKL
jgi:hypothetical protein